MPTRKAHARLEESLKEGKDKVDCGSGWSRQLYFFASRLEEGAGTGPEELLGAAHASCFAMALSVVLGRASFTPDYVDVTAHVTVMPRDEGFRIAKSHPGLRGQAARYRPRGKPWTRRAPAGAEQVVGVGGV